MSSSDVEVMQVSGPTISATPKVSTRARPSSSRAASKAASTPSVAATASRSSLRKRKSDEAKAEQEWNELEEGPRRRYKKPSGSQSPAKSKKSKEAEPKQAKPKKEPKPKKESKPKKEPKPKKVSKAELERQKIAEIAGDPHFQQLGDSAVKRIAKVFLERLYLINRFRVGDQRREEFDVCGSSGNVYKVTLANKTHCSCPDFAIRRQVCKHQLFVYLKVLRIPSNMPVYRMTALTNRELDDIFAAARTDPVAGVMASSELRSAWEEAVGYKPTDGEKGIEGSRAASPTKKEGKRLIPNEGDVCGVCYEDLEPGSEEGLEFCLKSCGRPIHTDCMQTWFKSRNYGPATCIWCRASWHETASEPSSSPAKSDGYGIGLNRRGAVVDQNTGRQLNLANAAGIETSPRKRT